MTLKYEIKEISDGMIFDMEMDKEEFDEWTDDLEMTTDLDDYESDLAADLIEIKEAERKLINNNKNINLFEKVIKDRERGIEYHIRISNILINEVPYDDNQMYDIEEPTDE